MDYCALIGVPTKSRTFLKSPKRTFMKSPKRTFMKSPKRTFMKSPKRTFLKSIRTSLRSHFCSAPIFVAYGVPYSLPCANNIVSGQYRYINDLLQLTAVSSSSPSARWPQYHTPVWVEKLLPFLACHQINYLPLIPDPRIPDWI